MIYFKFIVLKDGSDISNEVFRIVHTGISQYNYSPNDLPEVPYITIEVNKTVEFQENETIEIFLRRADSYDDFKYGNYYEYKIFEGRVSYIQKFLNPEKNYRIVKARNNLSLISQDFLEDKYYKEEYINVQTYTNNQHNIQLPSYVFRVVKVEYNGTILDENNWSYDPSTRNLFLVKNYPAWSSFKVYYAGNEYIDIIASDLLAPYNYDVGYSATPLRGYVFKERISILRVLYKIGLAYNWNIYANMDGDIVFKPIKIASDGITISENDGITTNIELNERFLSLNQVIVNGYPIKLKAFFQFDRMIDDFNTNGGLNNLGGRWEFVVNGQVSYTPSDVSQLGGVRESQMYGAKIYMDIANNNSSFGLKTYFTYDGSPIDAASQDITYIELFYRSTSRAFIKINGEYINDTLPSTYYTKKIIQIPPEYATNLESIEFEFKDSGQYEIFIDYIKFGPDAAINNTYIYDKTITNTVIIGSNSGTKMTVDIPYTVDHYLVEETANSLYKYYHEHHGVKYYYITQFCPPEIYEIGTIIELDSPTYGEQNSLFEIVAFDINMNPTQYTVKYLVRRAYTQNDLTDLASNDIHSGGGADLEVVNVNWLDGTNNQYQIKYNRKLNEMTATSKFNYKFKLPGMTVGEVYQLYNQDQLFINFDTMIMGNPMAYFFQLNHCNHFKIDSNAREPMNSGTTQYLVFTRKIKDDLPLKNFRYYEDTPEGVFHVVKVDRDEFDKNILIVKFNRELDTITKDNLKVWRLDNDSSQ